MLNIRTMVKLSLLSSLIILLASLFPTLSYAAGVNHPVGADAGTYIYNDATGLWENDHYTFDPNTGLTNPKDATVYTYNDATGKWDTTTWVYNAPSSSYTPVTYSVVIPPVGAATVGGPPANNSSSSDPSTNSSVSDGSSSTTNTVTNGIVSMASSGDATVMANTTGGNATTGNAQDISNLINLLQSSSNSFGNDGHIATFTSNINGDVNGDILLDPAKIGTIQPASQANLLINTSDDVNAQINNTLNVGATSGNATISQNTNAGDAATGNANAVANVMNVINSAISSGQSFLGVMNINGNLNGDILLPPNFVDQLLAANTPSFTIDTSNLSNNSNMNVNNNTTQAIDNNVNLAAASGTANVADNTNAGNATTGKASTNLTIFNLTGSNVVGTNNLLVFVNVLGQWIGMIVNTPPGTTAASLGSGINQNTTADFELNNNTNEKINNDIRVAAQTGNANVTSNTNAGSATTGNASASVNLLNILGSHLSFSNWFGVLFINVFGTWHGSFGVNTAAGDPLASNPIVASASVAVNSQNTRVFQFVPTGQNNKFALSSVPLSGNGHVLGENDSKTSQNSPGLTLATVSSGQAHHDWLLPMFGTFIGACMLGGERLVSKRKK